ncbi:protein-tyrosine-phosphatase [Niveispirillum sp.]|uniref:tyrosine phosphatase family protein n=1 Tax=Niveispirillum sp. TaxID=1917217 RepID=UPI0025FE08FB|nr:protein-tyrosine-phosphatase [Niveispirillum sp.]
MSLPPFVPFRLTVCGIEELPGHAAAGVTHLVSILDPTREALTAFDSYGPHDRIDLRFHDIVEELPDQVAPVEQHLESVLAFGRRMSAAAGPGDHLLVHCHMGISRSTAAMTLILAQSRPDLDAAQALAEVVRIRPQAWPNMRMLEIGGDMLGRRAELLAALREVYARRAAGQVEWLRFLRENHRSREVAHMG